jgi:hypothetical protein
MDLRPSPGAAWRAEERRTEREGAASLRSSAVCSPARRGKWPRFWIFFQGGRDEKERGFVGGGKVGWGRREEKSAGNENVSSLNSNPKV